MQWHGPAAISVGIVRTCIEKGDNVYKQFDSYRVYYQSAPQYYWQSRIYLYLGNANAGAMFFIKEGKPIPANSADGNGNPVINLPASSFHEIMALLWHEKPLFISLNTANGIGTVSTSNEPIGDED